MTALNYNRSKGWYVVDSWGKAVAGPFLSPDTAAIRLATARGCHVEQRDLYRGGE